VVGPAEDGGYYLIGQRACHPELFRNIEWGTDRVLSQTVIRAKEAGLDVVQLAPWADVDTHADIARVVRRRSSAARRTRAWARAVRTAAAPRV